MSARARILVCDDDPDLRDTLVDFAQRQGYEVQGAGDGTELRRLTPGFRPDLVILDLNLPGEDGLSLARWLRAEHSAAILMLTSQGAMVDRVLGLEMGADDYMSKPFDLPELRARIRAVLRRTMAPALPESRPEGRLRLGRCIFDLEARALFDEAGEKQALTAMEYDLLCIFAAHPRQPLSRDRLLDLAHHRKWDPYDRSIDNRIARLRRKVESDPAHPRVLITVRGEGYMFDPSGT